MRGFINDMPWLKNCEALLDGAVMENAYGIDEEAGIIYAFQRDEQRQYLRDSITGDPVRIELRGRVELRVAERLLDPAFRARCQRLLDEERAHQSKEAANAAPA